MTSNHILPVSDEDLARAYGIAQEKGFDDPSEAQINTILAGLQSSKQALAPSPSLGKRKRRSRYSSTLVEPPISARLIPSRTLSSSNLSLTDGGSPNKQTTKWGPTSNPSFSNWKAAVPLNPKTRRDPNVHKYIPSDYKDDGQLLMSGVLHQSDPYPTDIFPRSALHDFSTICDNTLESLMEHQPFHVLRRKDLWELLCNCFSDPDIIEEKLDRNILTTVYRVQQALEEIKERGEWSDEMLLGEIVYRCGTVLGEPKVIHVEDIVPCVGEEDPYYEREYWQTLQEQAQLAETGFADEMRGEDGDGDDGEGEDEDMDV